MVGICIKYFFENYGGMLQAYATIKMLEERKISYELIRYEKQRNPVIIVKSLPRLFNRILLNDKYETMIKKIGAKLHPEFEANNRIRLAAFRSFNESHFTRLSPVFKGYAGLCEGAKRYDAVVTGSDQLWSPAGLPTNFFNLMFVPDDIRKISYASSFGVKQIPWYQLTRTKNFLERIEYISMRENRGSEIVYELTGKKVPVVLDPVFCFDYEGWKKLIPVKPLYDFPYILAYFLGENQEYREAVKAAANKMNLKVVALRHMDRYVSGDETFGDVAPYDIGPAEFLNLIRGAEYVCTDSFHGSCFSIIHRKQFVVFNRYSDNSKHSKNSRIDSLCDNLSLNDRRFNKDVPLDEQLCKEIDYSDVEKKLNKMKVETNHFLDEAFGGLK